MRGEEGMGGEQRKKTSWTYVEKKTACVASLKLEISTFVYWVIKLPEWNMSCCSNLLLASLYQWRRLRKARLA